MFCDLGHNIIGDECETTLGCATTVQEMAIHGGIAEFDSASEDWLAYMECLD